jgi:hypothetical protein
MIPMILQLKIPRTGKPPVNLYLPLFLIWLLLLPFALLVVLLMLIVSGLTWTTGHGRTILFMIPMIGALLWNLGGLRIDVKDRDSQIYMSFW